MPFPFKQWRDRVQGPPKTPVNAAAMMDLEHRVAAYVDDQTAGAGVNVLEPLTPGDALTVGEDGRPASLGPVVTGVNGKDPVAGEVELTAADVGAATPAAVSAAVEPKLDISARGAANGVAPLVNSKVPAANLPSLVVTDTFVVASQAAMLALSAAEQGDVCVRTDLAKTFILKGTAPTVLSAWTELLSPTAPVQSVQGRTGAVTITLADVGGESAAGRLGEVATFAINPGGKWALCDGTAVTAAKGWPDLRAGLVAEGSPYGVSGSDPLLPDMRGRVPMGTGTGPGLTARAAGNKVGAESVTLTGANLPPTATYGYSSGQVAAGTGGLTSIFSAAGGGVPIANMQPSLAIPHYIRVLP